MDGAGLGKAHLDVAMLHPGQGQGRNGLARGIQNRKAQIDQAGKRVAPSAPSAEEVSPVDDSITISGKPDMVFQAAPQQAGRDPRLGVLGGIKRQVQIF